MSSAVYRGVDYSRPMCVDEHGVIRYADTGVVVQEELTRLEAAQDHLNLLSRPMQQFAAQDDEIAARIEDQLRAYVDTLPVRSSDTSISDFRLFWRELVLAQFVVNLLTLDITLAAVRW